MNDLVTRSGHKTSEFWFGMATVATIWINGLPEVTIPESQILVIASLAGAYTAGRTLLKNTAAKRPA